MRHGLRPIHLIVLVLLLAACARAAPATPPAAQADVCTAVANLETSIAALRGLDPDVTTVSEVRAAVEQISAAYQVLLEARVDAAEAGLEQFQEAVRDLRQAVSQLPDGTTIEGAANALRDELEAIGAASVALGPGLGCPAA